MAAPTAACLIDLPPIGRHSARWGRQPNELGVLFGSTQWNANIELFFSLSSLSLSLRLRIPHLWQQKHKQQRRQPLTVAERDENDTQASGTTTTTTTVGVYFKQQQQFVEIDYENWPNELGEPCRELA